jgi:putative acetyltransferase
MRIRAETPHDYPAIAAVHARAFDFRAMEAMLVALMRNRAAFDPELSLVAEVDGQIVGHALFSPQSIRLLGQPVRAVLMGPLGVDPSVQKQGVGGALMRAGHEIARAKGYTLSMLLGHPSYYPRFGYQTNMFGNASVLVRKRDLPDPQTLFARPPIESDVPTLRKLWEREESNVDFAIDPGGALLDWLSPNPAVKSWVFLRDEEIVGYVRWDIEHGVHSFCAADHEAARGMAAYIGNSYPDMDEFRLPLHPYSASASAFGVAECTAWDAGMACPLAPCVFDEFAARLRAGERLPGRPVWGVEFELE